jgi:hypothetical protein
LTYHPISFKQETLEEAAQSHLSKVADGKEQPDMLMKTSLRELMATAKKLHRRNEAVCKKLPEKLN